MYLTESHMHAFNRIPHTHLTESHTHAFNHTYMHLRESHMYALKNHLYIFNRITHACI